MMATVPTAYYRYKSLGYRYIRLIRLYPGSWDGGLAGDIEIDLEHKSMDHCKYMALSYTWGAPTLEEQDAADAQIFTKVQRCYPIRCRGKIILITQSLRDALKRMRNLAEPRYAAYFAQQMGRTLQTEFLWADGICINQNDLKERAEQVKLMAEIYSLADLTVAYVGEPDEHQARTRKGLELALTLAKLCQEAKGSMHKITTEDVNDANIYAFVGARVPSVEEWMEWAIFMSREWFFRTWVLQEAMLSGGENIYIFCGTLFIQADALMLSVNMVHGAKWDRYITSELQNASRSNQRYRRYERRLLSWLIAVHPHQWILRAWNEKKKASFYSMSHWQLPQTSCSDPRDRIYSTLGLAAEWENLDQRLLPVDYQLSVSEVFCRATKYVLMRTASLDMLSTVSMKKTTPKQYGLPSWCPDYSKVAATEAPNVLMDYPGNARTVWSASMSSHCTWSHQDELVSILSLQGIQCDKVETSCHFGSGQWPLTSPSTLEFLLQNIKKASSGRRYVCNVLLQI